MNAEKEINLNIKSYELMEVLVRIGLVGFLAVLCFRIFVPFSALLTWALILAIALAPFHKRLAKLLGNRQKCSAALIVALGLLLTGMPLIILSGSFSKHIHKVYIDFENDSVPIAAPKTSVQEWPFIGENVYQAWNAAATNLPKYLSENKEQILKLLKEGAGLAANALKGVMLFLAALLISGVMLAYRDAGEIVLARIFRRFAGKDRGDKLQKLSTATVRSVASGVIGVAFIQALLMGVGFFWSGIPAAGILAVLVVLLGIMQLPASIIALPAIIYLWTMGDASTLSHSLFTIYFILAGLVDNILKPLLLGRGVDAPMVIILIGALGGMISAGIIGLFTGAVLLAVGYQIFIEWVNEEEKCK